MYANWCTACKNAIRRYLLPPMSKTYKSPTLSTLPNCWRNAEKSLKTCASITRRHACNDTPALGCVEANSTRRRLVMTLMSQLSHIEILQQEKHLRTYSAITNIDI